MEVFFLTLQQMLMMFSLIMIGFFLRKKEILPKNSDSTMAKLEMWVFVPALSLFTQITKCNVESFKENIGLIAAGLLIACVTVLLSYPISRLFFPKTHNDAEAYSKNVFKYALAFSNYGFMGNFIILGVFGSDMYFKYSLFGFLIGILCTVWGLSILIPKQHNLSVWKNLLKSFTSPAVIFLVSGIILGLLNAKQYIPDFILTALESASSCQGPVAMVLAGFVIGSYDLKELFRNKRVYFVTLIRLILIPALFMPVLKLLNVPDDWLVLALIFLSTPIGLNTIVYPAAYSGETKTGASMVMISHTLSVITIPLMYLLFIELL